MSDYKFKCIKCGREYDPEGWDPMGGDCPVVQESETGMVITPDGEYASLYHYQLQQEIKEFQW